MKFAITGALSKATQIKKALTGQARFQKWPYETIKSFNSNGDLGKFHGEREVMIFKSLLAAEGRVCKSCYKKGFQSLA